MSITESGPRKDEYEVLPKLTENEENSFIKVCYQDNIIPLSIVRKFKHKIGLNSVIIEVTGMPHVRKTTMLAQFKNDCKMRDLNIDFLSEGSSVKKDPETMDEHNLGFLFKTLSHLFKDGDPITNRNSNLILDRGILGQIPFIEASRSDDGEFGEPDYSAELIEDFIVNRYAGIVDALVICNSSSDISLSDPKK